MIKVEHRQIRASSGYVLDAFRGDLAKVDGRQGIERDSASNARVRVQAHAQGAVVLARRAVCYATLSTQNS